jgi:addiction module HigA family antidote
MSGNSRSQGINGTIELDARYRIRTPGAIHVATALAGITADTALRLSRYFGNSADFWMGIQMHYDLEVAEDRLRERINSDVRPRQTAANEWSEAQRLERYFGVEAQFWLNLQSEYDLQGARRKTGPEINRRILPIRKDVSFDSAEHWPNVEEKIERPTNATGTAACLERSFPCPKGCSKPEKGPRKTSIYLNNQ